jgi:hypothetical protein
MLVPCRATRARPASAGAEGKQTQHPHATSPTTEKKQDNRKLSYLNTMVTVFFSASLFFFGHLFDKGYI